MPDDRSLRRQNIELAAEVQRLKGEVERLQGAGPTAPPSPFLERRLADRLRSTPILEEEIRQKLKDQDKALEDARDALRLEVQALAEKNTEIKRLQLQLRQVRSGKPGGDRCLKAIQELRARAPEVLQATPQVELLDTLLELAELS